MTSIVLRNPITDLLDFEDALFRDLFQTDSFFDSIFRAPKYNYPLDIKVNDNELEIDIAAVNINKEDGEEFEQKKQQPIQRPQVAAPKVEDDIPEPTVRATDKPTPPPAPQPAAPKVDQGDVSLDDLVSDWA